MPLPPLSSLSPGEVAMKLVTCVRSSGLVALALAVSACADSLPPSAQSQAEIEAWQDRAERVEIVRDDWGVPHIYAPTDADAVFGLMYAQAEDDFNRIEVNFLTSLGRMAEAEGEARLWQDLRQRLFIDPEALQTLYTESPQWLRDLMDGWADGLNFYLYSHPEVEPRVLTRFEPWMALSFSEGSIGGDIERVGYHAVKLELKDAIALAAFASSPCLC
jgi:acyl-homoserine-lactone acylase